VHDNGTTTVIALTESPSEDTPPPPPVAYASFTARARALVIDTTVTVSCLAAVMVVGSIARDVPGSGRIMMIAVIAIVLLYEPVLVSRRGATVGHRRVGIQVVTASGEFPGFFRAFARYLIKGLLGLPTFITMMLTRRHQALHDILTATTVRVVNPEEAESYQISIERPADWMVGGPSVARRLLVIAGFLVLVYMAWVVLVVTTLSEGCLSQQVCTASEQVLNIGATVFWLGGSAACLVLGWRGRLPGARRRPPIEIGASGT
jgi:uncharacterized RDD family membrane protein YckC